MQTHSPNGAGSVPKNGPSVMVALGTSMVSYQVVILGTPFPPLDNSAGFISPILEVNMLSPNDILS